MPDGRFIIVACNSKKSADSDIADDFVDFLKSYLKDHSSDIGVVLARCDLYT
jgi:hypothetical protein